MVIFLANMVGPNLWQMGNEIEKLALYCGERPVQSEDIEALAAPNLRVTVFKLTDYLSWGKTKSAIKILHELLEGNENIIDIFAMIVRHFRILIQVRACLDQDKHMNNFAIAQKIKEHAYSVKMAIEQVKNFDLKNLKTIYEKLLQIGFDSRGGKISTTTNDHSEMQTALEKFIVSTSKF